MLSTCERSSPVSILFMPLRFGRSGPVGPAADRQALVAPGPGGPLCGERPGHQVPQKDLVWSGRYESRRDAPIPVPCPSAALFHRSRAASSLGLELVGSGSLGLSSPINTLDASLTLLLGELSGAVAEAREAVVGVSGRRMRE